MNQGVGRSRRDSGTLGVMAGGPAQIVKLKKTRSRLNGAIHFEGSSMHENAYSQKTYPFPEKIVCLSVKDWWLGRREVERIRDFLTEALNFDRKMRTKHRRKKDEKEARPRRKAAT